MSELIVKIYTQDISYLVLAGIVCVVGVHWLRRRYGRRLVPLWCAMLVCWFGVVLWATVLGRDGGGECRVCLYPLHSYREVLAGGNIEILRSSFMNMALFVPGGLAGVLLLPRRWRRIWVVLAVVLAAAAFSAAIEWCQYDFRLGSAEIDDVLHNTAGAAMGCIPFLAEKRNN